MKLRQNNEKIRRKKLIKIASGIKKIPRSSHKADIRQKEDDCWPLMSQRDKRAKKRIKQEEKQGVLQDDSAHSSLSISSKCLSTLAGLIGQLGH